MDNNKIKMARKPTRILNLTNKKILRTQKNVKNSKNRKKRPKRQNHKNSSRLHKKIYRHGLVYD